MTNTRLSVYDVTADACIHQAQAYPVHSGRFVSTTETLWSARNVQSTPGAHECARGLQRHDNLHPDRFPASKTAFMRSTLALCNPTASQLQVINSSTLCHTTYIPRALVPRALHPLQLRSTYGARRLDRVDPVVDVESQRQQDGPHGNCLPFAEAKREGM